MGRVLSNRVLIYLGLSRDGKSAIFLVDEGVEAILVCFLNAYADEEDRKSVV